MSTYGLNGSSYRLAEAIDRYCDTLLQPLRSRLAEVDRWQEREEDLDRALKELGDQTLCASRDSILDSPERLLELLAPLAEPTSLPLRAAVAAAASIPVRPQSL